MGQTRVGCSSVWVLGPEQVITIAVTVVTLHHGNVTHTVVGTIYTCAYSVVLKGMGAVYAKPTHGVTVSIPMDWVM